MAVETWGAVAPPPRRPVRVSAFASPVRMALADLGLPVGRHWTYREVLAAVGDRPRSTRALELLRAALPR